MTTMSDILHELAETVNEVGVIYYHVYQPNGIAKQVPDLEQFKRDLSLKLHERARKWEVHAYVDDQMS